jgi:hypothetical protein
LLKLRIRNIEGSFMAVNPASLLKFKKRYQIFSQQHPKILAFFKNVFVRDIAPGTVIEIKVTDNQGKSTVTNMRLTPEDVETIGMFRQ